ncbi:MAG: gliding motility-associated C-terminal domain-containing protein, partial [Bacteroidota bacterium]
LTSNATLVLIVTDQYQCRDTDTVALTVARVNAGFNAGNTFCLNDSICVIDTSSNLNGILTSFNYNFGEGNPQSGANVCHKYTSPGSYSIEHIVIDDNGCTDTAILPVVIYPNPNADFTINDSVICSNEPVCVTDLSNGSTSISWGWNFGGPNANASGSNPACYTYNAPFQPDYIVQLVVTDLNNCTDTARRLVTVLEAPIADFDWDISCENVPMPLTNTSIAGDAVINSNQWTLWLGAPTPLIDNNTSTSFIFPIGFHDVQLIVTDLNGCVDTVVKTVRTDLSTNMAVNPGDTTICLGTAVDYTVTGLFNSVSWSPSVWVSDPNAASVIVTPQANVSYIVTALNGACAPAKDTITIQVIQPIPIELMASPEQIVLGLSSNITSQIPGRIDSIIWDPSSTLDCRDCRNPVATPTQTTTYTATIYYSLNGVTCTSIDSITIQFLNSCDEIPPYLPNTFTPNADGMNDVFMIRGVAGKKINYFRIFDRWGKLVFESSEGNFNDPRWGWDGNDNGGKKMNPAVFVYTYEIECVNGETKQGKGNVSLVR